MAGDVIPSRVARGLVVRGQRTPLDATTRHGTIDVNARCTDGPDGGRCEVCRRAFPDDKKRDRINEKARKTSACVVGGKRHARCHGWRFAPGSQTRDPKPCACLCHTDGRGIAIPSLEDYLMQRAREEQVEH